MRPEAIRGPVFAMGRPRRSPAEREAVRLLASDARSKRDNAQRLAQAVVQAYLQDIARTDAMERALFSAQQAFDPDPLVSLAVATDSPVSELFAKERLARYEARACQQLDEIGWHTETKQIARQVQQRLSRRYRDFLK